MGRGTGLMSNICTLKPHHSLKPRSPNTYQAVSSDAEPD